MGGWELVEPRLQKILNREYNRLKFSESYDFDKLWEASGKYRDQEDYSNAIWCLETIIERTTERRNLGKTFSRLSSCYRAVNKPDSAIDLYDKAVDMNVSPDEAFLTSLAAAYLDVYERDGGVYLLEKAKDFLDRAYKKSNGTSNSNLKSVYKRYDSLCTQK